MAVAGAALVAASCRGGGAPAVVVGTSVVRSSTVAAPADPGAGTADTTVAPVVVSDAWEQLPSPPLPPRRSPLVVALGDALVVVGGHGPEDTGPMSDRVDGAVLDAAGTRWRKLPDAPAPLGRESAAVVADGVLLVVAGNTTMRYDPALDTWTTLARPPAPFRTFARLVATPSTLYLLGGVNAAHVVNPSADGPLIPPPAALDRVGDVWRELPMPNWPGATALAAAWWTGTQLLLAVGPVDGGDAPRAPANPVVALDPETGATTPLPATPVRLYGTVVRVVDGDVVLVDQGSALWRLAPGATEWERLTVVPSAGQTSVVDLWPVDGHLVIDTGGGGTNGRSTAYRQASGAWSELGPVTVGNESVLVRTVSGDLLATDGVEVVRLRALRDRTVGLDLCDAAQLEAEASDATHLVVTNTSAIPCALDGQRPRTVDFRVTTDLWSRAGESTFLRLPAGGDGGYLKPGGTAVAEIVPGLYVGVDCPDHPHGYEGLRFSAPGDEEFVEVAVSTSMACPDLTALVASPSR